MTSRQLFPTRTPEQRTKTLADYLPNGEIFRGKYTPNTTLRDLLVGLSLELDRADGLMNDMMIEQDPRTTNQLLSEWESALGIPDGCFNGDGTIAQRRLDIVMKLSLAISTAESMLALIAEFGYVGAITSGSYYGAFPMHFPIMFFPTGTAARHTILVDLPTFLNPNLFPLVFPFTFSPRQSNIIECLLNRLKPANVQCIYRYIL